MNNKDLTLLSEIVKRLKRSGAKKIILFGSSSRGKMDKYSDIDVIVVKETKERFVKRLLEIESFCDLPIQVDFFVYTPQEFDFMVKMKNPFIENILRDGKIIYEEQLNFCNYVRGFKE